MEKVSKLRKFSGGWSLNGLCMCILTETITMSKSFTQQPLLVRQTKYTREEKQLPLYLLTNKFSVMLLPCLQLPK